MRGTRSALPDALQAEIRGDCRRPHLRAHRAGAVGCVLDPHEYDHRRDRDTDTANERARAESTSGRLQFRWRTPATNRVDIKHTARRTTTTIRRKAITALVALFTVPWFSCWRRSGYPGFLLFVALILNAFLAAGDAPAGESTAPQNLAIYANGIEGALVPSSWGHLRDLPVHGMLWPCCAVRWWFDRLVRERCLALAAAPQAAPVTAPTCSRSALGSGVAP